MLRDTKNTGHADTVARFGPTQQQGNSGGTGIALFRGHVYVETNDRIVRYALPLALIGGAVALYHALLVWGVVPKDLVQCGAGPSCAEADVILFGVVNFPLLSLGAFAAIAVLLLLGKKRTGT